MARASDEELAAEAGFTVAFFKSDPELWDIFKKARSQSWTGSRLSQAIRNSDWFKNNSEARRQAELLRTSDPAEYQSRRDRTSSEIESIARRLGLTLSGNTRSTL